MQVQFSQARFVTGDTDAATKSPTAHSLNRYAQVLKMRKIADLVEEIIPPSDYQHRNGFSNEQIIDSLTEFEKTEVEKELIKRLESFDDCLIGYTLAYLKSYDSLPSLRIRLNSSRNSSIKIHWANSMYRINPADSEMKDIAFKEFQKISEKYELIGIFHILAEFDDPRIKDRIKSFQNDKDYLIAYNARTALGQDTKELIERERTKNKQNKPWWKIW